MKFAIRLQREEFVNEKLPLIDQGVILLDDFDSKDIAIEFCQCLISEIQIFIKINGGESADPFYTTAIVLRRTGIGVIEADFDGLKAMYPSMTVLAAQKGARLAVSAKERKRLLNEADIIASIDLKSKAVHFEKP